MKIPVVFTSSSRYAPYCSVAIASLIENKDPNQEYDIFVFTDEIGEDQKKLENMSQNGVNIRCLNVSEYVNEDCLYESERYTLAIYYRLFAQDVLPQYDKILYLDCDIVVLKDLGEIYNVELGDSLVAAVRDYGINTYQEQNPGYLERLGLSPEDYFNAGILVMNLKQFRKDDIGSKCIEYINQHRDLRLMDQDALNVICNGRVCYLPEKWNMMQMRYHLKFSNGEELNDIHILHYDGADKPWAVGCWTSHLFFYQMISKTPYKDTLACQIMRNNDTFWMQAVKRAEDGDLGIMFLLRLGKLWFLDKLKKLRKRL